MHIVGFISWFAGLFYIVRLFIYHAEAGERPEPERAVLQPQLELMASRLWKIITVPAMVATLCGGITMVVGAWPFGAWLHWKFVWLAMLIAYHFACGRIRRSQRAGTSTWRSNRLRLFNELATMLMVAIVFTAVFKSAMSAAYGVAGLVALGVSLMIGIRAYRARLDRAKAPQSASASEARTPVPTDL